MDRPRPAPQPVTWTVSALLLAASDAMAARFGAVTLRGELSAFSRAASGHCYFTLKDPSGAPGLIRCAMFRRAASLLDFAPAEGQQLEARGRVTVYEARGELQLVVESLQRVGAGTLYEEFLRLKARLEAQGLFDPGRKRAIERFPSSLGVVTSPGAAALHDVVSALARRAPQVRVTLYPCLVQGAEAPGSIVAALERTASHGQAQTLLLVRGGGSLEDLWSFNDERVVRAVAASPIPVVCGVGHETDLTLADLAADVRAPTPTAAAELAAPVLTEQLDRLQALEVRAVRALRSRLDRAGQTLDLLAHRAGRPAARLEGQAQGLEALAGRLQRALLTRVARAREGLEARARACGHAAAFRLAQHGQRLDGLAARVAAAHPQHVLHRGFAWLEDAGGQPVVSVRDLVPGTLVSAVLADGRAGARIESVASDPPA
ncbi:MAG: exodeoxyribonuclease VII large subunit [Rubrivivax sp.]